MFINAMLVLVLLVAALAALGAAGYSYFTNERQAELRRKAIVGSGGQATRRLAAETERRREQITKTIKDLEERQRTKAKLTVAQTMQQAGLGWSQQQFYGMSLVIGVIVGCLVYFMFGIVLGVVSGVIAGLTIARMVVNYLRKRRLNKFFNEFPNAIDVIVRGVSAGLPLTDCMKVIAADAEDPIRSEFNSIMQSTTLGMSLPEAIAKMAERIPITETNFFATVISIQQKSGGNLSEAMTNLSKVLRDRKKIRQKADALSQEAKTSASILGGLPIFVIAINSWVNPEFAEPLFTTKIGQYALFGCAMWMLMGALVIRKMIQFEV